MVAGMLMALDFLSLACVIEAGLPTPRKTDENGKGIAQNALPLRSGIP
jgi:hypothetical protein